MKEFRKKVAVITGAASGIGRALADRCAQEGMKIVLADVEAAALSKAEAELRSSGATVAAVWTDVSKSADVESLARKAVETFGGVHLLFNNAGVGSGGAIWQNTPADWEWVIGVNLWGVINGIHTFIPIMLSQDAECHVVNTASMAGLVSSAGLGVYKATKHAIVSISETLSCELAEAGAKIGVSVLCPAWVKTRILSADRNRPAALQNKSAVGDISPQELERGQQVAAAIENGIPAQQVARTTFEAIRDSRFYILTHPEWKEQVRQRMENILEERNPT